MFGSMPLFPAVDTKVALPTVATGLLPATDSKVALPTATVATGLFGSMPLFPAVDTKVALPTATVATGLFGSMPLFPKDSVFNKYLVGAVPEVESEDEKQLNIYRAKYGDICVLMVICGNTTIAKLCPIEIAVITPFKFGITQMQRDKVAPYITEPFLLPKVISKATTVTKSLEDQAEDMILVIKMQSLESLADRSNFISYNNVIVSYIESLFIIHNSKLNHELFVAKIKAVASSYLNTIKEIAVTSPFSKSYEDNTTKAKYKLNDQILEGGLLVPQQSLEIYNQLVYVISQYKMITPKRPEDNFFDWYGYNLLRDNLVDEFARVAQYCLYHPSLITYAKTMITDIYVRGLWKAEYFDYIRPNLVIESFRVANVKEVNVDKDFFTIFSATEIFTLGLMTERFDATSKVIKLPAADTVVSILDEFVVGVLNQLDLSHTALTGSAICCVIANLFNLPASEYSSINIYARRQNDDPYMARIMQPHTMLITDYKDATLDLKNGIVVDAQGQKIAIFEFGADIDLAVLQDDSKLFDEIALKHFKVFNSKFPGLSMHKNIRSSGYYTYTINSHEVNNYIRGFRNVEIYQSAIKNIVAHHVPMVRGWYGASNSRQSIVPVDVKNQPNDLFLDVTALSYEVCKSTKLYYDNFYYFASGKNTPADIIYKYYNRGFELGKLVGTKSSINDTTVEIMKIVKNLRGKRFKLQIDRLPVVNMQPLMPVADIHPMMVNMQPLFPRNPNP